MAKLKFFICFLICFMHCSLTYCAENKFEWPFCETRETESDCGKDGYVFIATMDGNITALDFNFGFKCWSIVLDPKGFLSSTLSKLKVWENGTQVWIVPSLDGHMFKYDKMKLEPFSFNSEHLVNHAFIIDSSSSITGGKFKVIYGLNRHTGQLYYKCGIQGCQHFKTVSAKDVLIIEQWIHLVNAVDRVTAEQRWHFRGVEVKICDFNESSPVNTSQNVPETPLENTALVPVHNFNKVKKVLDSIKISLINGYAARLDHSSSSLIWLYKTSTPVVDVWFVQDKSAILVDPFSDGLKFFSPVSDDGMHAAWLFLGSFMGQLYVKQSKIFHSNVNDHAVSRPVPSKAFCLHSSSLIEPDTRYLNALVPSNINVKVHGVYYYANFSVYDNDTHCVVNATFPKYEDDFFKFGFWMKFNVFFAVCVLLALLYFLCLKRFLFKEQEKVFANESTSTTELPILPPETSDKTVEVKPEFSSRFHKDFEFITILGRGGFGVVMEVRNKMDDCKYAVKRICIKADKYKRIGYSNVMREVKALANLDHPNIVRYFNSWIEIPPIGWQEFTDEILQIVDASSLDPDELVWSFSNMNPSHRKSTKLSPINEKLNVNPLSPFDDNLDDLNFTSQPDQKRSSAWNSNSSVLFEEYVPSPDDEVYTDRSKNIKSNPGTLKLSPINEKLNVNPLNPFGDNLSDLNFTSQSNEKSLSSGNSNYSDLFEEDIPSPDNEEYTDFDNFKSNLLISKLSPIDEKLNVNPFDINLGGVNFKSQPNKKSSSSGNSCHSDLFQEYTPCANADREKKIYFDKNLKYISEVGSCYDEFDEPPDGADLLPENSKCLFVSQKILAYTNDNNTEFMKSFIKGNRISDVRKMLRMPKDQFIDENATFLHLKIINSYLSCRMNSIFLNKLHPYLFSDASFPDENHSEWTGWTRILDDVELHKISLHLFFFKNWLISVLCAVRFINSYYHNLLFSNLSNILWEINHLLEDDVCSTELPIRESFAIRIGIFFFLKKWNSKLAWPMKFPYLIKLRRFLFHQCRSLDSNQCTLNWQSIFYRSDINIFEKNLNFFQIWIISILCVIRLERSRVFINLLSNLSEILHEVISMSVDNTFIPMSTKEFLCMFGNLFHLPGDAIQLKDYENEQFLIMFHNTQLYKYRMIYMDDDDDKSRYLYIQMQLCRRDNLKTWIDLNCEHRNYYVVMKMFCQIVSAMHYVHKKGLMHRDLKPSNIYFSLEGLIKIGDFGLATQFDIYGGEYSSTSSLFSSHSYDIGTRMYMSPEQSSKKKYNYKTDIFSLGIILFELLVPFKTDSERAQTIYLVRSRQFTEDFVHKYEKECLLIKRMLDPNPKRRPTAWEILQHPLCLPYL